MEAVTLALRAYGEHWRASWTDKLAATSSFLLDTQVGLVVSVCSALWCVLLVAALFYADSDSVKAGLRECRTDSRVSDRLRGPYVRAYRLSSIGKNNVRSEDGESANPYAKAFLTSIRRYVPYDGAAKGKGVVCVDCTHAHLPTLTHHKDSTTPEKFKGRVVAPGGVRLVTRLTSLAACQWTLLAYWLTVSAPYGLSSWCFDCMSWRLFGPVCQRIRVRGRLER
jgi:hypothetical protein